MKNHALKNIISLKSKVGKTTYTTTKNADWHLIVGNSIFSLKSKIYKSKFVNTCMSSKKLPVIFDNNALKLL